MSTHDKASLTRELADATGSNRQFTAIQTIPALVLMSIGWAGLGLWGLLGGVLAGRVISWAILGARVAHTRHRRRAHLA